jgi:MarR family transcriptional regulator, lower aerobic nicotinate degradation pathway regulator
MMRRSRRAAGAHNAAAQDYVLERQIGHLLRRAHQRAGAVFLAEFGDAHRITPTQFAALVKLRDIGALSQNELGRLVALDPATIQGVVRRLTTRRLVRRARDPRDRRRAQLSLTPRGRRLVERLVPLGIRVSAKTLSPLSVRERDLLLRLLERLLRA